MSGSSFWEVDPTGNLITGNVHGLTDFELNAGSLKQVVTSGNFTAANNTRYTVTGFSTTVALPANAPVGTRIVITAMSAVITVQAPAFNYFSFSLVSSTLGGTIFSLTQGGSVELEVALHFGSQIQWNIVNVTNSWQISRSPIPYIIDQLSNQTQPVVKSGMKRDNSTAVTVDVLNGKLQDFSNLTTLDFQNRKLFATNGSTKVLDFSNTVTTNKVYIDNPIAYRFGDVTNYTEVNSANNSGLTFAGTVRPRKMIWIPVSQFTNAPGSAVINTASTVLNFAAGSTSNFSFHIPWDADPTVNLLIYVKYAPSTNAINTIGWAIDYLVDVSGSTLLTAGLTNWGVADSTPGVQDQVTESSPMQILANTYTRNDFLTLRFSRQVGGGYAGLCQVLGIKIVYAVSSMGN